MLPSGNTYLNIPAQTKLHNSTATVSHTHIHTHPPISEDTLAVLQCNGRFAGASRYLALLSELLVQHRQLTDVILFGSHKFPDQLQEMGTYHSSGYTLDKFVLMMH